MIEHLSSWSELDLKTYSVMSNPGSEAAIKAGCLCAVMDNHHGEGMWFGNEQVFWINGSCPIHGDRAYYEDYDV